MSDDPRTQAKLRCFTEAQWEEWSSKQVIRPNTTDWACLDCDPAFKERMMACGRCDWPCVEFFLMPDGTMEGRRMSLVQGTQLGTKIILLAVLKVV